MGTHARRWLLLVTTIAKKEDSPLWIDAICVKKLYCTIIPVESKSMLMAATAPKRTFLGVLH